MQKIKDIVPALLCRYVDMRDEIDVEMDTIYSLCTMLSLLEGSEDCYLQIETKAFAHIHQLISRNILNIRIELEEYILLMDARKMLEVEKI